MKRATDEAFFFLAPGCISEVGRLWANLPRRP